MFEETYLTLSQLNGEVRAVLEGAFVEDVWVSAEIAELRADRKGHYYLSLVEKDDGTTLAQARATIWSSRAPMLEQFESATGETLKPGLDVLLRARVRFHEVYGYSLDVLGINPLFTLGGMARKKRETLQRLAEEGHLERNRALPFPLVPQRVAVISSEAAAGYQDFVDQLTGNPHGYAFTHRLFPALMQGDGAEQSIVEALGCVREVAERFDVLVLVRGGGSQIDLSCFDSYAIAAEIATFPLPVVTGIGHERDDSVADAVAHSRVKTPTAAAELLISHAADFEDRLLACWDAVSAGVGEALDRRRNLLNMAVYRLNAGVNRAVSGERERLERSVRGCTYGARGCITRADGRLVMAATRLRLLPGPRLEREGERLMAAKVMLRLAVRRSTERAEERLAGMERDIRNLDPESVLRRGFSITRHNGKAVRIASALAPGAPLETQVAEGKIVSEVIRTEAGSEQGTKKL